jgi:chromosome partitioning protein
VKTVAIVSSKGGTGKTTIALHLAVAAAQEGRRVLVVDMDPQRSACSWRQMRRTREPDVVPARPGSLASFQFNAARQGYDLMLIDTPPTAGPLTGEAVMGSDLGLIITRPNPLDVWAVRWVSELVKAARRPGIFVVNQAPSPRRGREQPIVCEAFEQLRRYGHPVADPVVRARSGFSLATAMGLVAQEAEPASLAAGEVSRLFGAVSDLLWEGDLPEMAIRRRIVRPSLWRRLGLAR